MTEDVFAVLEPGDPAPWFAQRSDVNPRFHFHTAGGRTLVLCFYGAAKDAHAQAAIAYALASPLFDDRRAAFFGVSAAPDDETNGLAKGRMPGVRHFFDGDRTIARLYGACPSAGAGALRRRWVVIDPAMRVLAVIPFAEDRGDIAALDALLQHAPPAGVSAGIAVAAPALVLPRVFESGLCDALIAHYEAQGGTESGFMRDVDGKTTMLIDHRHKRRRDADVDDAGLRTVIQDRIRRRVLPALARAYQFVATRMERYIVACYDAEDAAHFNPHRDNTTKGTAHRKFAVSLLLNDAYEGGGLYFPEYGNKTYKPEPGAAIVFSCSLLHAVTPVTRGRRYAFLPFLYDDAGAAVRLDANAHLDAAVPAYGLPTPAAS